MWFDVVYYVVLSYVDIQIKNTDLLHIPYFQVYLQHNLLDKHGILSAHF